mmetsp:Transcript_12421/g.53433  ORF Transcript_12421/g.53433 Transcript_12421/m.53433 type:complete len:282 (-) Transcript_12421:444-1289(-)
MRPASPHARPARFCLRRGARAAHRGSAFTLGFTGERRGAGPARRGDGALRLGRVPGGVRRGWRLARSRRRSRRARGVGRGGGRRRFERFEQSPGGRGRETGGGGCDRRHRRHRRLGVPTARRLRRLLPTRRRGLVRPRRRRAGVLVGFPRARRRGRGGDGDGESVPHGAAGRGGAARPNRFRRGRRAARVGWNGPARDGRGARGGAGAPRRDHRGPGRRRSRAVPRGSHARMRRRRGARRGRERADPRRDHRRHRPIKPSGRPRDAAGRDRRRVRRRGGGR